MNPIIYRRFEASRVRTLALALSVVLLAPGSTLHAQDGVTRAFEARLVGPAYATAEASKGTVHGFVVGDDLKLIVAYRGASSNFDISHSSNLYQGDPLTGGTFVRNLALALGETGGFETSVPLTTELEEALDDGQLFVQVRTESLTPAESINGPLLASTPADYFETRLTSFVQGYPVGRGGLRAFVTDGGLRIVGYFNALASNWTRVALLREVSGGTGSEEFAWLWNTGESALYGGIDQVVPMESMDWLSEMSSGRISVVVETSRASDALRGRFRGYENAAPPPSRVLQPTDGSTVVIGGGVGEDPLDPDLYLGTVTLDKVDDADGDEVTYFWQLSTRPGFSNDLYLSTLELGIDSTVVPLTMASAAALFDALTANEAGGVPIQSPVSVFHRVVTSDGSRYTVGPVIQTTFVRGTVTSVDSPGGVDRGLELVGNYPNPFSSTTHVAFSVPVFSEVHLEVFDLLGRTVTRIDAGTVPGGSQQAIPVDGSRLPSGTYFYRLVAQSPGGKEVATGSLIVAR